MDSKQALLLYDRFVYSWQQISILHYTKKVYTVYV